MGCRRIRGARTVSVCGWAYAERAVDAVGDVGSGEDDGDARVEDGGGVLSAFRRDVNVDGFALAVDVDGDGADGDFPVYDAGPVADEGIVVDFARV